jgi:anti-sigma-K factor RskA
VSGILNISLNAQVHRMENENAQLAALTHQLRYSNTQMRTALADLAAPDSQRYPVANGEVVKHGTRLYIAMNALPPPPKGKVYQAWTLRSGATQMSPSVTFVPNPGGVAVVPIPVNASQIAAVAVSVEPEGGSKQPTSKPTFVLKFS